MAALLMDGDQGLPHGVGSVVMGDVNELIASDAFPNKEFSESVIEEPGLGIIGLHSNIRYRKGPIYYGKEFTEFKEPHDFFLPLYPVLIREFLGNQGQGLHLPNIHLADGSGCHIKCAC